MKIVVRGVTPFHLPGFSDKPITSLDDLVRTLEKEAKDEVHHNEKSVTVTVAAERLALFNKKKPAIEEAFALYKKRQERRIAFMQAQCRMDGCVGHHRHPRRAGGAKKNRRGHHLFCRRHFGVKKLLTKEQVAALAGNYTRRVQQLAA